jgi:hypothetical protein
VVPAGPPPGRISGEHIDLDLGQLARDLRADRPAARARYLGKITEGAPATLTIRARDAGAIEASVEWAGRGGTGLSCLAFFWFTDPRNAPLKDVRTGRYAARIGGLIAQIRPDPANGDREVVELRPAWIVEGTGLGPAGP